MKRALFVALLAVTASCAEKRAEAEVMDAKQAAAWRKQIETERAAKDKEFATSPTSVLAGVVRFAAYSSAYAAVEGDELVVGKVQSSATGVVFTLHDRPPGTWLWSRLGSRDEGGVVYKPTWIELTPRFGIEARISDSGEVVIQGFDRQRKELLAFKQLAYFAPDPKWRVNAKLERFKDPTKIELATSRGLKKSYLRYGRLKFDIGGTPHSLTAFRPANSKGKELFVPFRDKTSGKESYAAARFLDLEEPVAPAASVVVDFNQAYNPLCAYSDAYNCPMPPAENTLTLAVNAGEQTFGLPHSRH